MPASGAGARVRAAWHALGEHRPALRRLRNAAPLLDADRPAGARDRLRDLRCRCA